MSFERPTLAELRARVAGDVASRLGLSSLLPRSVLLALANAEAAGLHLLHGHLEHLAREQYPQTASSEGLVRWSELAGIQRKAATYAQGTATFTGVPGSSIPNNTTLARVDEAQFKTRGAATVGSGGTVSVTVRAVVAGELGNSPSATELSLAAALVGIQATAIVDAAGLTGGLDAESDESLRARTLEAFRAPVLGGSAADWVTWALEVPGVTRAWSYGGAMGPGTVGVTFTVDDASYGPIPNAGDLATVTAHLEERRPVTMQLFVYAPTPLPLVLTLELTPDTPEVRAEVEAGLRDLLRRESEPGGTLLISHIREAISLAVGETDHVLASPTADVVAGPGELLVFGSVSYT